jgi:hypothetical protein
MLFRDHKLASKGRVFSGLTVSRSKTDWHCAAKVQTVSEKLPATVSPNGALWGFRVGFGQNRQDNARQTTKAPFRHGAFVVSAAKEPTS